MTGIPKQGFNGANTAAEPSIAPNEPPAPVFAGSGILARPAEWIASRRGLARLAIAAIAGALGALAMAPYHFVPLLLIAFPVLVWQIDGSQREKRRPFAAASIAWAFGSGFFALGLYWIGYAFLVDAKTFGALMPFAVAALAAGLALFPALTTGVAAYVWRNGNERVLLIALAWSSSEWLRGHLLSGFPWNLIGYTWGSTLPVLQATAIIGSYGLSFLTILAAATPAVLAAISGRSEREKGSIWWPLGAALTFSLIAGLGALRLDQAQAPDAPGIQIRLIQPSVPQRDKIMDGNAPRIFDQHLELMRAPGADKITLFVWPEAAVPALITDQPAALAVIAETLGPNQTLIAGDARLEQATPSSPRRFFNSLFAISTDGKIVASYDKHHLVPFGEYLPFPELLESIGLRQIVDNASGFSHGAALRTLEVPGLPDLGPLICYEAIFPGRVIDRKRRPQWLLNITDDTWFGLGAGPRQHFESARIRAIEEGLPLIRAANNGISAVVDAKGRLRQSLALNRVGVLDTGLPAAGPSTIYAQFGDLLFFALLALAVLWVWSVDENSRSLRLQLPSSPQDG